MPPNRASKAASPFSTFTIDASAPCPQISFSQVLRSDPTFWAGVGLGAGREPARVWLCVCTGELRTQDQL